MSYYEPQPYAINDVQHIVIRYNKSQYNGHPNRGGLWNFGNGEIAMAHYQAPSAYQDRSDVTHDAYMNRAIMVLERSLDHGRTWPENQQVVLWERRAPLEKLRAWLSGPMESREEIDMTQPGAIFHFGTEISAGEDQPAADGSGRMVPRKVTFAIRSADKGRTWEKTPTVLPVPHHRDMVIVGNFPMAKFSNGVFGLGTTVCDRNSTSKDAAYYITENHGLTWHFITTIAYDPRGVDSYTYVSLLQLPNGRLQSYMMRQNKGSDINNLACMAYSDDAGMTWSAPKPIVRPDGSAWVHVSRPRPAVYFVTPNAAYRAPYPLRLRDGRIIVFFSRRKEPYGIGAIVSEDEGQTWSREIVLRDDASSSDLGYPVATQLEDGRVFVTYYYTLDDGNGLGGTRFIAGTFFSI
ncbi:MAG: exo-alpha-sialidase [Chloroflexi bacterium]|nr:exo-alpha-sialidase [Chloroflexota bacterium]